MALRFVTEEFAQTAVGRMIRGVKSFAAELEREKIRERTSRGKLARVKSGKLHGSARPIYGYRYTDDDRTRLMVAPEQAAVVRRIFALAEAGTPIIRICEQLNAEGIPAPRSVRQWARSTVAYLLAHQAYIGRAVAYRTAEARQDGKRRRVPRPEAEWVALPEGVIPPLIAPATFAAVRAQLARNQAQAARRSLDPQAYLLRAGYAICGVCGKTLVATGAGQRSGRVYPTYRAAQARHRECAPGGTGFSISATELDADIRAEVARRLLDPSIIERELLGRHDADPVADALALVDRSLEEARRKQANLAAALPLLDDEEARAPVVVALNDLAARLKSLRAEREGLQVQRHDWQLGREEVRTLAEWCRTAAENLAAFTYDDWRDALLALGVRVHIFPDGRTPRRWEIFTTADVAPVFVSSPT